MHLLVSEQYIDSIIHGAMITFMDLAGSNANKRRRFAIVLMGFCVSLSTCLLVG